MKKVIKLSETQLKNIINRIVNEQRVNSQPTAPNNVGGFNVGNKQIGGIPQKPAGPNLSCVAPEDYKIKGSAANSFKYTKPDGEYIFYSNGDVWLYQLNTTKRIKTGKWVCGNSQIEVRWDNDPKSVNYQPLPKTYFGKGLNSGKCAQEVRDIFNGKFLFAGCKGKAVSDIQNMIVSKMNSLKITDVAVPKVDGIFGDATKKSLQAIQSKMGIKSDGVVGGDTLSFLQKI